MNKLALISELWLLILISGWVTGCTGMVYQHMNDPARDAWQKPQAVMAKLDVVSGMKVADLGAGGGYFTWRLAEAVGKQGKVYAVDIDDVALDIVKAEMSARGISNVVSILAELNDPKLPEAVDLVFCSDTYHHMQDRVDYFRSLQHYLKPAARVAILDFHPHGIFSGLLGHGTDKAEVQREMELAGYRLVADYDVIDRQNFQIFTKEKP